MENNQIVNRLKTYLYKGGFSFKNYPKKLKYIKKFNKKFLEEKTEFKKINSNFFLRIQLATFSINKNITNFWSKLNFKDREDLSHIHRWTWAIYLLTGKDSKKNKLKKINFIKNVINNWCYKYGNYKIDCKNIIFEPYNISERLANYSLLVKLGYLKEDKEVLKILKKQLVFLTENLEFYYKKNSNHILNNARGILLFSEIINNKPYIKFALNIILFIIPKFIDKNGFFKFCSSHYQLIFSRWIFDINFFSKKKYINGICKKALSACYFFIQNNNNRDLNIPFFGNISPDFKPDWILNFINQEKSLRDFIYQYWKNYNNNSLITYNECKGSNEWIKNSKDNFTIFLRNPKIYGFDFNHSHNDFFHFVLYYKKNPIIVDLGKLNYSLESHNKYNSGKFHNSIIINNNAIHDEYLPSKIQTKLGLKNINNSNYKVINKKNKIICSTKNKNEHFFRELILEKKKIIINNNIKLKNFKDIGLPFFVHTSAQIKKINKNYYKIKNKKFNATINSLSKNIISSSINNLNKSHIYSTFGYGDKVSTKSINFYAKKVKNLNLTIEINFY